MNKKNNCINSISNFSVQMCPPILYLNVSIKNYNVCFLITVKCFFGLTLKNHPTCQITNRYSWRINVPGFSEYCILTN